MNKYKTFFLLVMSISFSINSFADEKITTNYEINHKLSCEIKDKTKILYENKLISKDDISILIKSAETNCSLMTNWITGTYQSIAYGNCYLETLDLYNNNLKV